MRQTMKTNNVMPSNRPPLKCVTWLTAVWLLPLLFLLVWPTLQLSVIHHNYYVCARNIAILVLIILVFFGITKASRFIGSSADLPWYTSAWLVALVLFWGLFPPSWFFLEYYLFDSGYIALPQSVAEAMANSSEPAKVKADFMASTKTYADLASKIWVAVSAALAATIAASRK